MEASAAVSARGLVLSVGSKRGQANFPGKWASDGRMTGVELTFSAVDLSSIKSGW